MVLQVSYENTSQDQRQPPLIIQVSIHLIPSANFIGVKYLKIHNIPEALILMLMAPLPAWPVWKKGEFHILGKADSSFDGHKVFLSYWQFLMNVRIKNFNWTELYRRSIILPDLRNHGESPPSNFMSLRWVLANLTLSDFLSLALIILLWPQFLHFAVRQMSADLQRLTSHLGVAKVLPSGLAKIVTDWDFLGGNAGPCHWW